MANRIVSVHAGIYGMGIYAIMLPSSGFSVAHYSDILILQILIIPNDFRLFVIVEFISIVNNRKTYLAKWDRGLSISYLTKEFTNDQHFRLEAFNI